MRTPGEGGAPSQALDKLHGRAEAVLRGTLALDPDNARALFQAPGGPADGGTV